MTDTAENAPENVEQSNDTIVSDMVSDSAPADIDFSFIHDKYKKEGRSDQEAAFEQAKAYTELQKRFGAFIGAPDEYEIGLSDELKDRINLEEFSDDPLLEDAKSMAKEWGMSNERFNEMVGLFFKHQLSQDEAFENYKNEELKALGSNGQRRLDNIQQWAKANLDAENSEALFDALTSSRSVKAVEALIAKTRNVHQVHNEPSAPAINADKLKEMQAAKDQYGNPKMNDPAYAKEVRRLYGLLYGEEPHTVTIGR